MKAITRVKIDIKKLEIIGYKDHQGLSKTKLHLMTKSINNGTTIHLPMVKVKSILTKKSLIVNHLHQLKPRSSRSNSRARRVKRTKAWIYSINLQQWKAMITVINSSTSTRGKKSNQLLDSRIAPLKWSNKNTSCHNNKNKRQHWHRCNSSKSEGIKRIGISKSLTVMKMTTRDLPKVEEAVLDDARIRDHPVILSGRASASTLWSSLRSVAMCSNW